MANTYVINRASTAVILAGGMGTRLRSVISELPKPMAPIRNRPFLAYLLDYLRSYGIQEVVLSIGYLGEKIQEYFGTAYRGIQIRYVVEKEPLGTGGAVRKAAESLAPDQPFWLLNGDSSFEVDLHLLYHCFESRQADIVLALRRMYNQSRYGLVDVDGEQRVQAFLEKQPFEEGLINGGIYLLRPNVLNQLQLPEKCSFERDVLEAHVNNLAIYGQEQAAYFIDIGIPEDYQRAQDELPNRQLPELNTLFLDRDGVINRRIPNSYVTNPDDLEFLPKVKEALALLAPLFKHILVVTNQQGVGKGIMEEKQLEAIHQKMVAEITAAGGRIDKVYACTELASKTNNCRKPNPTMGEQAKRDFPSIEMERALMVGDSLSDIAFGKRLGMKTALIPTKAEEAADYVNTTVDFRFDSLFALANFLKE